MKNPVAKNAPEFNKARVFRDRKTHAKETGDYKEHHRLAPYERQPLHNLLLEWETDEAYEAEPVLGDDDFNLDDIQINDCEIEEEKWEWESGCGNSYCHICDDDYHKEWEEDEDDE